MTKIPQLFKKLKSMLTAADDLSLRERLLVFGSGIMLLGAIWHLGFMQPLAKQATNDRTAIESQRDRVQTINQTLEEQVMLLSDVGTQYRQQLAQIQRSLDVLTATLGDYAGELIDPAEMSRVLEGVLKEQSELHLIRIRNLAPEELSASTESHGTTFYKHGFEIEFEGSYFGCLAYLQEIEALPWRFYWQILDLEVLDYPQNRIRLEVSTLSLDEEWIGA